MCVRRERGVFVSAFITNWAASSVEYAVMQPSSNSESNGNDACFKSVVFTYLEFDGCFRLRSDNKKIFRLCLQIVSIVTGMVYPNFNLLFC
jgi:hypothetical protein